MKMASLGQQFWVRVRKEIDKNDKPFVYEFSLTGQQPKVQKFRVILGRFVQIFKEGMRHQYLLEDQQANNYWDQLQRHLAHTIQMKYIVSRIYEGKNNKLRIYFALLMHTKKLFQTLQHVIAHLGYLYEDIESKRKAYPRDIELVQFFRTADVQISCSYISNFVKFKGQIMEQQLLLKKDVQSALLEIVDHVQNTINEHQRQARAIRQLQQQQRKQKQAKAVGSKIRNIVPSSDAFDPVNRPARVLTPPKSTVPQQVFTPSNYNPLAVKPKHMKNSQFLFVKKYKDELQIFSFNGRPVESQNKQKCFEQGCGATLSAGFLFMGSNMNYCHYTGQWFCNQHFSDERIQIPFKVTEQFDVRGYNVSKRGYYEIKSYFTKPIIKVDNNAAIVKRNKVLFDFLVLKRQIHLMYDSICETQLMDKIFNQRINYCLRDNYLSLKNLYDVYNGHELPHLQGDYSLFTKHFYRCEICQARKGRLCNVCKHPPKIFAFELRDTYSCEQCRKISHRRCLVNWKCLCEQPS